MEFCLSCVFQAEVEVSNSKIHGGFYWQTGTACFQGPSKKILDL